MIPIRVRLMFVLDLITGYRSEWWYWNGGHINAPNRIWAYRNIVGVFGDPPRFLKRESW